MQRTTIKQTVLALMLASALPLAACGDSDTPTSPTQPGPPVAENPTPPPPPPTPEPTPPPPTPAPPPTDNRPSETITGPVINLARSGEGGLDIQFRIDDFTVVRAAGSTPVIVGSNTSNTSAVLEGQTVTVEGRRTNGFLDASRITLASQ